MQTRTASDLPLPRWARRSNGRSSPAVPRIRVGRLAVALIALPLSLLLVAGCSSSGDSGGGGFAAVAPDEGSSAGSDAAAGGGSVAGGVPEAAPPDTDRPQDAPAGGTTLTEQIVRTGDVSVDVDDITSAANRVTTLVQAGGGNVGSDQRHGDAVDGTADLVVRLPPDSFDGMLESVSDLGEELSRSVSADDVSTVVADVDARVRSLQNSVDRLLSLAGQAVSISDLIAIESELSARQGELESLQAQQRALADQVNLATLSVHLSASSEPAQEEPGFLASLADGWNALLDAGRGLISIIGLLLPWLVLLVVIAVPVWFVLRRRRSPAVQTAVSAPAGNEPGQPPA